MAEFNEQQRADIAIAVMQLLDNWELEPGDQAALLGLPGETKPRALSRFRQGTPFPEQAEMSTRIGYLFSMQHSLETAFPHNPLMGKYWITTENPYFNDISPLAFMLKFGLEGMETVVRHLNGSPNWNP
jgi:hypothetical protein